MVEPWIGKAATFNYFSGASQDGAFLDSLVFSIHNIEAIIIDPMLSKTLGRENAILKQTKAVKLALFARDFPAEALRFISELDTPIIHYARDKDAIFSVADLGIRPSVILADESIPTGLGCMGDSTEKAKCVSSSSGSSHVLLLDRDEDIFFSKGRTKLFTKRGEEPGWRAEILSAHITALIASGFDAESAVDRAESELEDLLKLSGSHSNPILPLIREKERMRAIRSVKTAADMIIKRSELLSKISPEVGINVAESVPCWLITGREDVAAVEGRIVRVKDTLRQVGCVELGASSHLARALIESCRHSSSIRGVVNIAYSPELVEASRRIGLKIVFVDRRKEPPEIREKEGATMGWVISEAYRMLGGEAPDAIYDVGDVGKEAMIRFFGRTAPEAVEKLIKTAEEALK
ncbi:MAG: thiamine-phosphate synthase family protein [Fervidicoccaceae archaeon]